MISASITDNINFLYKLNVDENTGKIIAHSPNPDTASANVIAKRRKHEDEVRKAANVKGIDSQANKFTPLFDTEDVSTQCETIQSMKVPETKISALSYCRPQHPQQ